MPNTSFADFKESITANSLNEHLSLALQGLWHDARGDWDKAHECAQNQDDRAGAWVHAYLHRKEGDASNAAYWYGIAHQPVQHGALEIEWEVIVKALLASETR